MKSIAQFLLVACMISFASLLNAQADSAYFLTPKYSLSVNETYSAPIRCKEFEQVLAVSAHIKFDPTLLQFVEIIPGTIPGLNQNANFGLDSVGVGNFRMLWDSGSNYTAADDDVLFSIKFKALQATTIEDNLAIYRADDAISSEIVNEDADVFYIDIHFTPAISGSNDLSASESGLKIVPNPMHQNATITSNSKLKGLDYKLFDNSGKMVRFGTFPENGSLNLERRNLLPGVYIFKLENKGKQLASERLILE